MRTISRLLQPLAALRRVPAGHVGWRQGVVWALAAAGASFLLHWAVEPFFQPDRGLIVFIPAIVLVTLIAGPRFGVLTAAISGIAVLYVTLPPVHTLTLTHPDTVSLCIYVISSGIAVVLVHWLRESRAQERLLRNELQHRTKNLLALVHGLAQQTFRGEASMQEARDAFITRLAALNRANETMGESDLDHVGIDRLVRSALTSFSDHFACRGIDAYIDRQTARNLSLALHELATNSTKYGALSAQQGTVEVGWEIARPGEALTFVWRELGGPPVSPPTRRGFGTRLLNTLFEKGQVAFDRDGLVYRVEIPLAATKADPC